MPQLNAARSHMIEGQVRTNDVHDLAVIEAMGSVQRELYVPADKQHLAYADLCVPLKHGRHLLDPRSFAKLLQLAQIRSDERVLDIASGTGYSTAVLCLLSNDVVTLEEDPDLVAIAQKHLAATKKLGKLFGAVGPIKAGLLKNAPYDVIFVNGAVTTLPVAWAEQLKPQGRLVAIVANGAVGKARLFVNQGGKLAGRDAFDAIVPLLPGFEPVKSFTF